MLLHMTHATWGVWGSVNCLHYLKTLGVGNIIPTKTSEFMIQSCSKEGVCCMRCGSHVLFTRSLVTGFLFHFAVMYWSRGSLWLILFNQCWVTVSLVCTLPWMTLSHHRTQMRCADSDIRICRKQVWPLSVCWLSHWAGSRMEPHPSTVPRWISGHSLRDVGQVNFARCQIISDGPLGQSSIICSMDSVIPLQLGIPCQKSLTLRVP